MSDLEDQLEFQMRAINLSPEKEYRFHPVRKWRADFAFPDEKVLIECEGGVWGVGKKRGRHIRGEGFRNDCIKYNEAALCGYVVLRFTSDLISSGKALDMIEMVLLSRKNLFADILT